jgi:uncharacterized membrane protein
MLIGIAIHILAAIIWLGGLFYAYLALQPNKASPELSVWLPVWSSAFGRFLLWGRISSVLMLGTGFVMTYVELPDYVRAMMALGITAMAIYAYLDVVSSRRFRRALSISNWSDAERRMKAVRLLIAITVALGIVAAVIGASGRYYG